VYEYSTRLASASQFHGDAQYLVNTEGDADAGPGASRPESPSAAGQGPRCSGSGGGEGGA
jgi:hypothetical protein